MTATMIFSQEVQISPEDRASRRAVEIAVTRGVNEPSSQPSYRVLFCLPKDKHNTRGFGRKVYGVAASS